MLAAAAHVAAEATRRFMICYRAYGGDIVIERERYADATPPLRYDVERSAMLQRG